MRMLIIEFVLILEDAYMGRLTFVFNQEKLKKACKSESDMLSPMREYAQEYGIIESKYYGSISFSLPRFDVFVKKMKRYYSV